MDAGVPKGRLDTILAFGSFLTKEFVYKRTLHVQGTLAGQLPDKIRDVSDPRQVSRDHLFEQTPFTDFGPGKK